MSADRLFTKPRSSKLALEILFKSGTLTGLTDAQLLGRFVDNHDADDAFAMIVERHGPMILRTCRSILRNDADSDDALQVTFLVLARKAGSLRKRTSLAAWLHSVAVRTAKSARGDRHHRQRIEANAPRHASANDAESLDDLREHLQFEVAKLPEGFRDVIVLCEFEGLSHEEAAWQLGCASGTIKSRLHRARKRLRVKLEAKGWTESTVFAAIGLKSLKLPLSLPTIESITQLSLSIGGSLPARLVIWRSLVLKGLFVRNLKILAATSLIFGVSLIPTVYFARARAQDLPKPKEDTRKADALPDQDDAAKLYAILAKTRLAMAESLDRTYSQAQESGLITESDRDAVSDELLAAQFDLVDDPKERIAILRERLKIANRANARIVKAMEQSLISEVEAERATLKRLAIATQLAKEQLDKGSLSRAGLEQAEAEDLRTIQSRLNRYSTSELTRSVQALLQTKLRLPEKKEITLALLLKEIKGASRGKFDSGLPIYVDPEALQNAGVTMNTPVSCPGGERSIHEFFEAILGPLGLKHGNQDGLLVISTK